MRSVEEYIREAGKEGHTRAGIVLGIRMAVLGMQALEVSEEDLASRKLVVFVETERCLPDAIELVTGCRLGNRTLKLRDMGKMAATFVNLRTGRALRIAVREDTAEHARLRFPELEREEALARACCELDDGELFRQMTVRVALQAEDVPGYHSARIPCVRCGEGISFGREITRGGEVLCRACAGKSYYEPGQ